jgi:deoxyribonuclease V
LLEGSEFKTRKAREIQKSLSTDVILEDRMPETVKYVASVDVAYLGDRSIGAAVILDYENMKPVETEISCVKTAIPYIPTFLSFREIPPTISAIRRLKIKPDVYLVDGHGLAHPFRLGFATHLGLVLDSPNIGVAKRILCGEVVEGGNEKWKPLIHNGEVVGAAVSTRTNVKPVYVSIGNKVSLKTAIKTVLHCSRGHRIPQPLREAHMAAERAKCTEGHKRGYPHL